jgi:SAM-dependent methyltransferase
MSIEQQVSQHYAHGSLEWAVLEALRASGADTDQLRHTDLAPVDEFHIGGRQATMDLAEQLAPSHGMRLIDVGCGLGGASRYFAQEWGCRVDGVDLTAEYVAVAAELSRRVRLEGRVTYHCASALSTPFAGQVFDGGYMLHVGMNIADKGRLFTEIRRVLKTGALFGIFDVMLEANGSFMYPVPWAATAETNFIETAAIYRTLLTDSRFDIVSMRSRREFAIQFFHRLRARMARAGPSPLGLHIVMGESAPQKVANMLNMLEAGVISPTEIIVRSI